jgi:hypothetical protein
MIDPNPEWNKVRMILEYYLKRDIKHEKVTPEPFLQTFEILTSELLEKTKRANCNCVNHEEYEELKKEEQELITLRKMMKWEKW